MATFRVMRGLTVRVEEQIGRSGIAGPRPVGKKAQRRYDEARRLAHMDYAESAPAAFTIDAAAMPSPSSQAANPAPLRPSHRRRNR